MRTFPQTRSTPTSPVATSSPNQPPSFCGRRALVLRRSAHHRRTVMRHIARQAIIAALAAVLLLTGAFNLRSVIGGSDDRSWEVDLDTRSTVDALVDAPVRVPSELDDQIASLLHQLREKPNENQAATSLGL